MLDAGMDQQQKNTNNLPPYNSFDFLETNWQKSMQQKNKYD